MIQNGTRPVKKDHQRFSYHRTFGSPSEVQFATAPYNFDAGFGMPDQEADGLPCGCTGYTQTEICQDEDKIPYKPKFTYDKTLFMEGKVGQNVGCSIEDSKKSTRVYGVQAKDETSDEQALVHRRGADFDIVDGSGLDAFDSMRSFMERTGRSISLGSPWPSEFERAGADGIVPSFVYSGSPNDYPWHNSKICGVEFIHGVPYLINKSWQGTRVGKDGWLYFSRERINYLMAIPGTEASGFSKAKPEDIQRIRLDIIATALSYIRMIIAKLPNLVANAFSPSRYA